jgi:putative tricarboxylic transport membrane protein
MGARAVGAGMAALGAAVVALAGRLAPGTDTGGPGAGFLPALLGVVLVGLGAAVALRRAPPAAPGATGAGAAARGGMGRAAWTVAAAAAYVALLEPLGFVLATVPFLLLLLVLHGERRWPVALAVALAATGATYALFGFWLRVPLPEGLLGP